MFSSKFFTVTIILSFLILVATLVIQIMEMNTYELFNNLF